MVTYSPSLFTVITNTNRFMRAFRTVSFRCLRPCLSRGRVGCNLGKSIFSPGRAASRSSRELCSPGTGACRHAGPGNFTKFLFDCPSANEALEVQQFYAEHSDIRLGLYGLMPYIQPFTKSSAPRQSVKHIYGTAGCEACSYEDSISATLVKRACYLCGLGVDCVY